MDGPDPFRTERRRQQDERDRAEAAVREAVEPVPDVVCTACPEAPVMEYQRALSKPKPGADAPVIEAVWECPTCQSTAYGYVTDDGLTPVLDRARPADEAE
ncbi:MAG: hypothetical protein ACI9CA_000022 [Natronomonas sp.]|jgi:hypothetical protein